MTYSNSRMDNFWIDRQGSNYLKGVEGDRENPPRLPAYIILDFLKDYPDARKGYYELKDTLQADEQERLENIIKTSPNVMIDQRNHQEDEDYTQKRLNGDVIRLPTQQAQQVKDESRSGLVLRCY